MRSSKAAFEDVLQVLDLERLEQNLFRGESRDLGDKSVFGGQVLGQALNAARQTVEHSWAHSMHAYFVRPGDMYAPIVYEVERIRDGRSFAVRRVHAIQHGKPIFSTMCSFQAPESGLEHQTPVMPEVPSPEDLISSDELVDRWMPDCPEPMKASYGMTVGFEFRLFEPANPFKDLQPRPSAQQLWFKSVGSVGDDAGLHQAMLVYASDFNFLGTAMRPHATNWYTGKMIAASLDHAIWFHRPFRVDEWLLYSMDSATAQSSRGLNQGHIFSRAGELVATVMQESLMRQI